MARILIKGTQITVPNTVGAGTSFSEATLVRLVNKATGTDYVVTVQETAGGTTVGTFTILRGTFGEEDIKIHTRSFYAQIFFKCFGYSMLPGY